MLADVRIGARWDDASQNDRFCKARALGLLEYVEVNYPISPVEDPTVIGLPIVAHTSNNALCSAFGLDPEVVVRVRDSAQAVNSPWVGEHLALLGPSRTGALGYVINPLFTQEFADIAIQNVRRLAAEYRKPLALELGPLYTEPVGDFRSELEFLGHVANAADASIILDLTHWTVSNKNLRRSLLFGLEHLPLERVIEIHIAGMRKNLTQDVWYDAHGQPLSAEILGLLGQIRSRLPNLQAVTLEQSLDRSEDEFLSALKEITVVIRS